MGYLNVADLKDGHTLGIATKIDESVEQSKVALRPDIRLICGWDDDVEIARQLFERVAERYHYPGGFRSAINDYAPGDYFISVTECPYAYIALEAANLGIPNVKALLMDDEDDDESRAASISLLDEVRL